MNETQLISQLTAALDDAAAPVRMPAGAAVRARAQARRRRLTRGGATAIAAAGLAAGLALTVAATNPSAANPSATHPGPGPRAQTPESGPAVLTVGYVTSRAKAAAADMSGMIVKQIHGSTVTWFDYGKVVARYQTHGSGGRLVSDEREWYTGQTTRHRVYVDYQARTWWTLTQPDSKITKPVYKGSATLPAPQDNGNGQVSILGHRTIDGTDTILVKFGPPRGYQPTAYSYWPTEYLWLDTATYLPVRATYTGAPAPGAPAPGPGPGLADTTDFAYLPATPANEAIFNLTPPAGFKQVSPPPFRGDGQPGLGQIP